MIKPKALVPGDTVGIVAPSDAVDIGAVRQEIRLIESWGLKVKIGRHVAERLGNFSAGSPAQRMEDLQTMINDDEVHAIWAADGGYAASEVLPMFSKDLIERIRQRPCLFIGYSDVCLLLNALLSVDVTSLMGPNVWGLSDWDEESLAALKCLLFGEPFSGLVHEGQLQPAIEGEAEGQLIASNLDTLIFSLGTWFDPLLMEGGDVIIAIEDLDIEKSLLQRQIDSLFNHRKAHRIKGLLVGRLTNITEKTYRQWGETRSVPDLIKGRAEAFKVPLAFCDDFGHPEWEYPPLIWLKKRFYRRRFIPLPNGIRCRFVVASAGSKLEYLESVTSNHHE